MEKTMISHDDHVSARGGGTIINHRNDTKRYRSTYLGYWGTRRGTPSHKGTPEGPLAGFVWIFFDRSTADLQALSTDRIAKHGIAMWYDIYSIVTPKRRIIFPMDGNRSAPGPQTSPNRTTRDPPENSTPETHNPAKLYYLFLCGTCFFFF